MYPVSREISSFQENLRRSLRGPRSISSSADEFRPAIPRSGCSPGTFLFALTITRNDAEWIDKRDGAGYSWASALTGRLLPAAREASHLFSFSVGSYLLSAWYQRDTGKYERRSL